ncbi:glycosyl transferase [Candidatus Nitromaritima sp. SCGC AAA799-A02]|nr:glycosyl transferase [Candidatus Nitromaritima sp. SCGC AAA799-A02]
MEPLVSVVVTTKNEEKHIKNCLNSIKLQNYPAPRLEIIVVDNQSEDKTREISLEFTQKVFTKGPERSAQRNYGILDISSGDYVIFIDADMILAPSLIRTCVETIKKSGHLALHIPEIVLGQNYFSQVRRFERNFYNGTVIDGARFFKKDAFVRAGGFDETMSGPEDWDIDKKIKQIGSIGLITSLPSNEIDSMEWELAYFIQERGVSPDHYGSVIYHNEAEFNLGNYLFKKNYYAQSLAAYAKKWGAHDPDIKRQLGAGYRFFGVFMENGKWRNLLNHPGLAFGMYFLRFMVGIVFLAKLCKTLPKK